MFARLLTMLAARALDALQDACVGLLCTCYHWQMAKCRCVRRTQRYSSCSARRGEAYRSARHGEAYRILVGHGARGPEAPIQATKFRERVARRQPGLPPPPYGVLRHDPKRNPACGKEPRTTPTSMSPIPLQSDWVMVAKSCCMLTCNAPFSFDHVQSMRCMVLDKELPDCFLVAAHLFAVRLQVSMGPGCR